MNDWNKELQRLLAHAQGILQAVYGFKGPDIRTYLVDRGTLAALAEQQGFQHLFNVLDRSSCVGWLPHPDRPDSEAQVFVYFTPRDILAVSNAFPLQRRERAPNWMIDADNVRLFMDVAAHAAAFLHYVYCLSSEIPLSPFHCNLQNQIDQFVFIHALCNHQMNGPQTPEFLANTVLYPGLHRGERVLSDKSDHRHAQVFAWRYMRYLHTRFLDHGNYTGYQSAVREFFYKSQNCKISDINAVS